MHASKRPTIPNKPPLVLHALDRQVADRYLRPLDQLVIGRPVRLAANGPDGTRNPAFRVEHAADQQFGEGAPRTWWDSHQKKRNPFRKQHTNRGRKRHEREPEIQYGFSLVAALLALKS